MNECIMGELNILLQAFLCGGQVSWLGVQKALAIESEGLCVGPPGPTREKEKN